MPLLPPQLSSAKHSKFSTLVVMTLKTLMQGLFPTFIKVSTHFQLPPDPVNVSIMEPKMKTISSMMPYTALCAAFDMFLTKFSAHPFYRCRFGSMGTRWKDCGGLPLVEYIGRTQSFDFKMIFQWLWNKSQQADFDQLFKSGNEVDKPDSFTPYCSDFGLFIKSPYALTSTPNFSMFYLALLEEQEQSLQISVYKYKYKKHIYIHVGVIYK